MLLSLIPYPIRSLEEYCFNKGVGGSCGISNACKKIKLARVQSELLEGGLDTRMIRKPPPHQAKQCTSIAEACLVAMLSEVEQQLAQKDVDPLVEWYGRCESKRRVERKGLVDVCARLDACH